jgi:hypothetical protein
MANKQTSRLSVLLCSLLLLSCTYLSFANRDAAADSQKGTAKAEVAQKQQEAEPKPGDIRVIDGVEYIYAKNRRYMSQPYEPEYVWTRRDQYTPGLSDSLRSRSPSPTKEEKEMEARIAKLEDELKKRGSPSPVAPQAAPQPIFVPPVATVSVSRASLPTSTPNYPSQRMKRHVLLLPVNGATDPRSGELAERVTSVLIAKLESTGMIICLDPATVGFGGDAAQPKAMKDFDELHGIQAVVRGTVSSGMKLSFTVYNAETGLVLRQLSTLVSREQDALSDTERLKALDLEPIAEDMLNSILSLDWHGRIASTEQGKIFINAGKLSGLEKGDTLEVFAPGAQIIDVATNKPLGKLKGEYKGELEVAELFGVDASWARPKRGERFSPTDLVYLKR